VDLAGYPRRIGPHVDMGAYETVPPASLTDAVLALKVAGGLVAMGPADHSRLDVAAPAGTVDILDVLLLAWYAMGQA